MSGRDADDQCVDVNAFRVESARILEEQGDFVVIHLEAWTKVQHWEKYHRILSVESKGAVIVHLDAKDAAALRDQITDALEG